MYRIQIGDVEAKPMPDKLFDFESDFGARYDHVVQTTIFGYDSLFPMILALLTTRLAETAQVLVVGSGTGAELAAFGSHMPHWSFTGVDPSEQMVQQAQAKLERLGLSSRVRLHTGYTDSLPADDRYDAATLVLVLHFMPDNGAKLAVLKHIAARLKSGASFALVDHHGDPQSAEFQHLLAGWRNFQVLRGMPPDDAEALLMQALNTHHFISEARTLALLDEAGFHNVERFFSAFLTGGWLAQRR
jgi:tRNA (cmo5U34)-methyltransferase